MRKYMTGRKEPSSKTGRETADGQYARFMQRPPSELYLYRTHLKHKRSGSRKNSVSNKQLPDAQHKPRVEDRLQLYKEKYQKEIMYRKRELLNEEQSAISNPRLNAISERIVANMNVFVIV